MATVETECHTWTTNLEICLVANVFIKRYGDDALIEATVRGVRLLKKGETGGYLMWEQIVKTIDEIERTSVPHGSGYQHWPCAAVC